MTPSFFDRPRTDLARYLLVTVGLSIGVYRDDYVLAVALAVAGYVSSAFVAHPRAAVGYWRRWPAYRRYLADVRRAYGNEVDLGTSDERRQAALAGAIRPFRVFVSSTFVDLADERDRLAKDVFPGVARECERRGVVWAPVDLRWGITEIKKNAGEVTRLCLQSVERSRPNTVGIIGSRYGTRVSFNDGDLASLPDHVTQQEGLSLTHLELRHASHSHPTGVTVFVMDVPREGDEGARVDAMLAELRAAGVSVHGGISDSNQLVDLARSDLARRLEEQAPDVGLANHVLEEVSAHRLHEERLAARPQLHADTLRCVDDLLAEQRMPVLRGRPGSGRSTLLAQVANRWRADDPDAVVVCRFVGLTDSSLTWPGLARSIAGEVSLRTGRPVLLPDDVTELSMALMKQFIEVQSDRRIHLCIDGLERLRRPSGQEEPIGRGLGWLPQVGESVRVQFVPTVATDDLDPDAMYAYPSADIPLGPLSFADRLTLARWSLDHVDRDLPGRDLARIVEHQCAGDPSFLSLMLDELHRVPSHEKLGQALDSVTQADTTQALVARCLDREFGELGEERAHRLGVLLTFLTWPSAGLTSLELADLAGMVDASIGQSDVLLLRERTSWALLEVGDVLFVKAHLADAVRRHLELSEPTARRLETAWIEYFTHESRRFAVRSLSHLVSVVNETTVGELVSIVRDARGLLALRDTFGADYASALRILATVSGRQPADLVREAAAGLDDHGADVDVRLGVAEICLDYRLVDLARTVAACTAPQEDREGDVDLANRALAVHAKAALRGGRQLSMGRWQLMLDQGMRTRSSNAHLAMAGMGALLSSRGNVFWAQKYFKASLEVAFACGNLGGIAGAGANSAVASATDGNRDLFDQLLTPLRVTFEKSALLAVGFGEADVAMTNFFRLAVVDLKRGDPSSALSQLYVVGELAADRGVEHFVRLKDAGDAVALAELGHIEHAEGLVRQQGINLREAYEVLEQEVRRVTL